MIFSDNFLYHKIIFVGRCSRI